MMPIIPLLQLRWKLAITAALIVVLLSLALLAYALLPSGETARLQATLAPTLFVPPGGAP
jgi:hypothetical protein